MKALPTAIALAAVSLTASALELKGLEVDRPADCAAITAMETRSGCYFPACEEGRGESYK